MLISSINMDITIGLWVMETFGWHYLTYVIERRIEIAYADSDVTKEIIRCHERNYQFNLSGA